MSFSKAVPLSRSISLLARKFPARWIRLVCLVVFYAVVLSSLPIHVKHGNVSAQGAGFVTVYPGAYQTPDPGQGGEAISNTNSQGHGSTTVDAPSPSNQTKTSLWHSFPNVSGNKTRVTLKIDWSLYAYIEALGINNTGNARASYNFRIEYSLNGGSTWTSLKALSDSVAIRGEDEDIASVNTGGSESVDLPNPGAIDITQIRVRDYINGSASASGEYSAAISIVSPSVLPIRVEIAGNDAAFVSQNVPATMLAGESYAVTVSMLNQGVTTWTPGQAYRLGSQNPQDNSVWGLGRVGLSDDSVNPGATTTFSFVVTAPGSPGSYNFQWRMVQDGVEWFGAMTPNIAVQVVPRNDSAEFISQTAPSVMEPGAAALVSITFRNTGNTTWTTANAYLLGSQSAPDLTWGTNRVFLEAGEFVPPGALKTFSFQAVAPSTTGSYNFQWRMLREGVLWFGDLSPNLVIAVGTTGLNCLPNAPLPLISSTPRAGGGENIASTAPSEVPKRCGQKISD
jgi:hypothetical protein